MQMSIVCRVTTVVNPFGSVGNFIKLPRQRCKHMRRARSIRIDSKRSCCECDTNATTDTPYAGGMYFCDILSYLMVFRVAACVSVAFTLHATLVSLSIPIGIRVRSYSCWYFIYVKHPVCVCV